jgi:tRNA pseudouridine13 synthase
VTWPYLTDSKLKIAAKFKASEEDFLVEEIPQYLPNGSGEHLYILLEKIGLTTDQVIHRLAQSLKIKPMNIGYAGKKDRIGRTRQWFSLLRITKNQIENLNIPGTKILEMDFHKNKLRLGHLKGNRFIISLKDVEKNSLNIVKQILEELEHNGIPNYFGPQRFGVKGDNPVIGLAIFNEDWQKAIKYILGNPKESERSVQILKARELFEEGEYKKALELWPNDQFLAKMSLRCLIENEGDFVKTGKQLPKKQLRFFLNSLQSFWFNQCLAKRLLNINKIWTGDLAYLHRNGAVFRVLDEEQEQPRINNYEISPSGPVFGSKMIQPEGEELDLENDVLQEYNFQFDNLISSFRRWNLDGERRSFRVQLKNVECFQESDCIKLSFDLDSGSYATTVVREILKENFEEPEVTLTST